MDTAQSTGSNENLEQQAGVLSRVADGGVQLITGSFGAGARIWRGGVDLAHGTAKSVVGACQSLSAGWSALRALTGNAASLSVEVIGGAFETVLARAASAQATVGGAVEQGLVGLAGDPNTRSSFSIRSVRLAVGLLPIIGNTQAYAQARSKYQVASASSDDDVRLAGQADARRDCLIAATALAIEIATLGVSGKIDKALKLSNAALTALNTGKIVKEETRGRWYLPKVDLDFISSRADRALQFGPLRDAMDLLLRLEFAPSTAQLPAKPL